jgi:gluconolactonase
MQQNTRLKNLGYLTGALLMISVAHAENTVTPAIAGVVAKDTPIELIKEGFDGTEGPIGLPNGNLLFTETKANRIVQITPDGKVSSYLENSNGSNGLALGKHGELFSVQQVKPRVGIIYPVGKQKTLVENFEGQEFQRLNDLVLNKKGGIYFTDIGSRKTPENPNPPTSVAALYYLTPAGALKRIANDIERPNGVQLSRDEKTLYVANTAGEYLLAYTVAADGSISGKRDFAKLAGFALSEAGKDPSSGADGIAIDNKGRVYVASNAGIEVFSEKGEAVGVIPLPKKPQNLAFAGKDKKTLYVVGRGDAYKINVLTAGFKGRAK